ncbi:hypothetical protein ACXIUS_04305 [Bosea thiooxidans]|nr:hypothetical protein [Bosea sp. (in: a-proteobacteria)]
MAKRSTASRRIGLMGLAVAGALAGSAGGAAAQYYYYDEGPVVPYPPVYGYGYGYRYAPRIAEPVTQYDIRRIAAETYGFVRIDRLYRTDDTYVVDGMRANGQRQRLILDAFAGNLIRRVPLRSSQAGQGPDIARIDPQQEREPPHPRLAPRPPQRPAELRPPASASAPATVVPPSPAASPAPEQAPTSSPAPQPPVEASAPAVQPAPPPAAAPAAPSPGPINPETGADKPKLVNPQDVRGTDETERKPPLSTPTPPASAEAAVPLAPVQGPDSGTATPKPDTPIAPVAPLN